MVYPTKRSTTTKICTIYCTSKTNQKTLKRLHNDKLKICNIVTYKLVCSAGVYHLVTCHMEIFFISNIHLFYAGNKIMSSYYSHCKRSCNYTINTLFTKPKPKHVKQIITKDMFTTSFMEYIPVVSLYFTLYNWLIGFIHICQ